MFAWNRSALLSKKILTRNQLKKEFVKTGESEGESQAGYFIALISNQLGQAKKDITAKRFPPQLSDLQLHE